MTREATGWSAGASLRGRTTHAAACPFTLQQQVQSLSAHACRAGDNRLAATMRAVAYFQRKQHRHDNFRAHGFEQSSALCLQPSTIHPDISSQ